MGLTLSPSLNTETCSRDIVGLQRRRGFVSGSNQRPLFRKYGNRLESRRIKKGSSYNEKSGGIIVYSEERRRYVENSAEKANLSGGDACSCEDIALLRKLQFSLRNVELWKTC